MDNILLLLIFTPSSSYWEFIFLSDCPARTSFCPSLSHRIRSRVTMTHLWVHLRGQHLGELGDEVIDQLVALLGDQMQRDQVTGALQHLLQLLL